MRHTGEEIAFLTDLLDRLGEEQNAMTVVELDGFVAGLVLCPEWIGPAEWLPLVWGGARASEDVEESVDATLAVAAHYRRVAEDLASDPQGYRTVLGFDPDTGVLLGHRFLERGGPAGRRCRHVSRLQCCGKGGCILRRRAVAKAGRERCGLRHARIPAHAAPACPPPLTSPRGGRHIPAP